MAWANERKEPTEEETERLLLSLVPKEVHGQASDPSADLCVVAQRLLESRGHRVRRVSVRNSTEEDRKERERFYEQLGGIEDLLVEFPAEEGVGGPVDPDLVLPPPLGGPDIWEAKAVVEGEKSLSGIGPSRRLALLSLLAEIRHALDLEPAGPFDSGPEEST